jgi:hypothetical protein
LLLSWASPRPPTRPQGAAKLIKVNCLSLIISFCLLGQVPAPKPAPRGRQRCSGSEHAVYLNRSMQVHDRAPANLQIFVYDTVGSRSPIRIIHRFSPFLEEPLPKVCLFGIDSLLIEGGNRNIHLVMTAQCGLI